VREDVYFFSNFPYSMIDLDDLEKIIFGYGPGNLICYSKRFFAAGNMVDIPT
jgi:hypothetical protein